MHTFATTVLATILVAEAQAYYSGAIKTHAEMKYGRFKTRIQQDAQKGTVTSFFTYWEGNPPQQPWSRAGWNEIDVELVPSIPGPYWTNIIYSNRNTDPYSVPNFDPSTNWHEYQIEWTPEYIAWELDGVEVRRTTGGASVNDMTKEQNLFMNFWTPEFDGWRDGRNDSTMPWEAKYDYVEVHSYDVATQNFKFEWRDDFNFLDEGRWRVADGYSIGSSSSVFKKSHTYVENGNLVLFMDKRLRVAPAEPPLLWDYGNPCDATKHDVSGCANCEEGCHKSWPFEDPLQWKSNDAACRCLERQRTPEGYTYRPKFIANNAVKGSCHGCDTCAVSWPIGDPLGYQSREAMPRCTPVPQYTEAELTRVGTCGNPYDGDCGADCYWCSWTFPKAEGGGSPNAGCKCRPESIIETVWGGLCNNNNAGQCGSYCKECRTSWKADDVNKENPTCRCRNWW